MKLRLDRIRLPQAVVRRAVVFALALVLAFLFMHEVFGDNGLLALRRQKLEYESLQRQIQQLQEENQKLEQQIKALKSDPKAIEQKAREQLRLARPGEIILTLPEKDSKSEKQPTTAKDAMPK